MTLLKKIWIVAAVVAGTSGITLADTVWLGESGRNSIKIDGVKIQQFADGKLVYVTDSGMQAHKPMSQLQQINITGESSFNSAEDAYAARDYATAITGYQSVLNSSSKDWMQTRAAMRLVVAAKVMNRFDAEVAAYVTLVQKDPAAAAQVRPAQPPDHAPNLDAASSSIASALSGSTLTDPQKSSLLSLQLQIDRAKGDTAAVNATLQQLVGLGGASPADVALASANVALDSKQYSVAASKIDQNRALFTDPAMQVEALFALAQAKQGLAADKNDPEVTKDLGLAYMRVVTFGSQLPDRPHVLESLYQAAQIEEKLKEPQAAMSLYRQLVNDKANSDSPAYIKAKADIDRLNKEGVPAK